MFWVLFLIHASAPAHTHFLFAACLPFSVWPMTAFAFARTVVPPSWFPPPSLPPHLQSFLCNRLKYYDFPKSLILCLFFTRHPYVLLENSVGYSASPPIFFPIYLLNPCLLRTTQTSMLPPRCTSTCPRVHLLLSRRPPFMTSSIKPTPSLYQSASTFHF